MSDETLHSNTPSAFEGQSGPVSAVWEAVKSFPAALPGGALVGIFSGLAMAGGAYLLGDVGFIHHFIDKAGGIIPLAGELALTHAAGHAAYDGIMHSKATYDRAQHHNTFFAREDDVDRVLTQEFKNELVDMGLNQHTATNIANTVGIADYADNRNERSTSQALKTILDRGSQVTDASWAERFQKEAAERRGGVNADLSI